MWLRRVEPRRRLKTRVAQKQTTFAFLLAACFFCLVLPPRVAQGAEETWRILAVRVSFSVEDPDDGTTSGNGAFDLRTFDSVRADYVFPFDAPPHDRSYFEAHLQALRNYYLQISDGQLNIEYTVFPEDADGSYILDRPLKEYGNGRTRNEIAQRITQLFRDGVAAADSAEGANLDFSAFQAFVVFHAGLGAEAGGQAINDIPSAFVSRNDLDRFANGPVAVDDGAEAVHNGMLLPEAVGTDGRAGLNGTLVRFFAHQLGLPGLSNFEDELPAVGDWSPLDTGGPGAVASAARLGLQPLSAEPGDSLLIGFVPSRMLAWSRIRLGWLEPTVVTRNDTVRLAAPHVAGSNLPQAVKIPVSATEYFLLENRISRLVVHGRKPEIEFSSGDRVWLSVDDYDAFIPGSGILIWHVDDAVIQASGDGVAVNSNPQYLIAPGQYRRGISLEEADGLEDIGNNAADRVVQAGIISLDAIEGGARDPFYSGNASRFGPDTVPATNSNLNYPTGVTIQVLSPPADTMDVVITFDYQQDAWPATGLANVGLQAPRAIDLDGDGIKEILRSGGDFGPDPAETSPERIALPLSVSGNPAVLPADAAFPFVTSFTPAVGDIDGDGEADFTYARGPTPVLWRRNGATAPSVSPAPEISCPPLVARFADGAVDIWGWTNGDVTWGNLEGANTGVAQMGGGPVVGLAAGNVDDDPASEIVALTGDGGLYVADADGHVQQLGDLSGSVPGTPVLGDLDRDGRDEIVALDADGVVSIFSGGRMTAQSVPVPGGAGSAPVLGDLDEDGYIEVIFGGEGRLWVVRFNGVHQTDTPLAFPLKDETGLILAPPVLADINLDGDLDIFAATKGGLVYGLGADGSGLASFPLPVSGPVHASPLLDDLDDDGTLELVVFTTDGAAHLWHLETFDAHFTGNHLVWSQAGGGPGNAGRLLTLPSDPPPETTSLLLPPDQVYCYPNPIRGTSATIRFFLGRSARVQVAVLNALGEIVDRMTMENPTPRTDNELRWNTGDYASGFYVCRVEAISEERTEVRFVKTAIIK